MKTKWWASYSLTMALVLLLASCGQKETTHQDKSAADYSLAITQPSGRFIIYEALSAYKSWDPQARKSIPFTELVFDINRPEVEALLEDGEHSSFMLIRMGNGAFRLDSLYDLRYDQQALCWRIYPKDVPEESYTLEAFTLPDTAKMSAVSGFKFRLQRDLLAGIYTVADKNGEFNEDNTIAITADGQLVGVKDLSRYNLVLNGEFSNSDLIPMQLFNRANKPVALVGTEFRSDSSITLWRMKDSAPKGALPYLKASVPYARLKLLRKATS